MRSYREYCPIARASEIVAERWTPLVIRNLLYGCHTFTEIARGVPAMSRSLLIKRLKDLERSGVIIKATDGTYQLTDAGADLAGVIDALEVWGQRWLEVTTEHTDPGFVLWAWARYHLDPEKLPDRRVLVESSGFPTNRQPTDATGCSPSADLRSCAIPIRAASPMCSSPPARRRSPGGTSGCSTGDGRWPTVRSP
jgi:DNA-binding HxlR family transcriptional regulator